MSYLKNIFTKCLVIDGNTRTATVNNMNIHRIFNIILYLIMSIIGTMILVYLSHNRMKSVFFCYFIFYLTFCVLIMLKKVAESAPNRRLWVSVKKLTHCFLFFEMTFNHIIYLFIQTDKAQ